MRQSLLILLIASPLFLTAPAHAQLSPYSQDFEILDQFDPDALTIDGWFVYGNVFDADGNLKFGYGPFGAPNVPGTFSGIDSGQGGPNQGAQQLVVISDYQCCVGSGDGHFNGTDIVESLVFQEQIIGAEDMGTAWVLRFDAKRGNINQEPGATSTAQAFIRILDPDIGFALTYETAFDTTVLPVTWTEGNELQIVFDNPEAIGKVIQFGFSNRSSNFESTGVFYDNISFSKLTSTFDYEFDGEATVCSGFCDDFSALGGPPTPSQITSAISINAAAGGPFGFADVDPDIGFELVNQNAPLEPAIFAPDPDPRCDTVAPGRLCNPLTANPLPLDSTYLELRETGFPGETTEGTLGAVGEVAGLLLFEFVYPPFSDNGDWLVVDLLPDGTGTVRYCFFYQASGCIPFATEAFVFNVVWTQAGSAQPCGNSVLEPGEACDDGNTTDGDGCSSMCDVEAGFECTLPEPPNMLLDASFEAGTPNPDWAEASSNFGTPLCDVANCGTGTGTGPFDGDWWAWFGGVTNAAETGSVEQSLVIPPGFDTLDFWLEIPAAITTGFLNVSIDGNVLASYTDLDGPFVGYQEQILDIGAFADGNSHTLRFESTTDASPDGATNFFVDAVRVTDLDAPGTPSVCSEIPFEFCASPQLPIPDNDPVGLSASILPDSAETITDLDVSILTGHTWVGDLVYTLEHVDTGTSVVLIDRPGFVDTGFGCSNDNIDVVLDDGAPTAAEDQCDEAPPAIGGVQAPNNSLAAFNGESLGGTWTLTVTDNASGDTGTLEEWCLVPTISAIPDTDGDGVLDDIDNCTEKANPGQEDSNGDQIGNACDPDIAGPAGPGVDDCIVNFLDLNRIKGAFLGSDPDADFTGPAGSPDGIVNFLDLNVMKEFFLQPPGPSAAGCTPAPVTGRGATF